MAGWFRSAPFALSLTFSGMLAGCAQQSQTVTLRSLESSGEMSFVCLGADFAPRSIDDCPDTNPIDGEERHLFSLVTQSGRGEVALVDLTSGTVVDDEPTIPGFNFLPIGNGPTSIVSTPGGLASFVGVTELGKEGIFALPSSCIGPRPEGEHVRDFTMWPACRLPSAPGDMTVLIDHLVDDDGDAATPPVSQCAPAITTVTSEDRAARDCPADLSLETTRPGRRMLAVTLPSTGEVAIIDAQALLDRDPGSFDACPIQRLLPLRVDLPKERPLQTLPADLDLPGATRPVGVEREPRSEPYVARPAGLSLVDDPRTGEQRVFLADQEAPVIHVLDAKNPCAVTEKAPLLPASFTDPTRVVTTKKIATSPLTSGGQRYLYAIDDLGGGVMIFDVSTGATERTPLLRPRSAILPYEDPDRISFSAPAKDVTFALQDKVEVDPATGSQRVGVFCDPDPTIDPNSAPALYRPAPDYTSGAAPGTLRGVFGFVALSSGQVAVIDVEDFDEKCRRPIVANSSATEDFRGCSGDPNLPFFTADPASPTARFTVTNEASCHTVESHRARSSVFVFNDPETGVRAPALRVLPTLISDVGRTLVTDVSVEGRQNPKMLGVNFSKADRAQVYVGATLLDVATPDSPLLIDPTTADQNSVVLDVHDPRSYLPQETFSATFEGSLFGERTSAQFSFKDGQAALADGQNGAELCSFGIEDAPLATSRGRDLEVAKADLAAFADSHADYVRITSDLLDEDDAYWLGAGARCGGANTDVPGGGFLQCRTLLGTRTSMGPTREFEITEASSSNLLLTPRRASPENKNAISTLVACCFPQAVSYEVRAANAWVVRGSASPYRHDVIANPDTARCQIDTNPLRTRLRSRAYELSCDPTSPNCATDGTATSIGLARTGADETERDVACIVQNPATDAQTAGESPCIYSGLSSTFAIYRGQSPSVRDWQFSWDVIGGFSPLLVNLAVASDPNSNPQSMKYSPELGELVIADGASKGLVVISLATFASQYFY
jgi:hypothetical protein